MWITKSKWAGAAILLAVICFMFADCAKEQGASLFPVEQGVMGFAGEAETAGEEAGLDSESAPESKAFEAVEMEAATESKPKAEEKTQQPEPVKAVEKATPEPAGSPSTPAPSPPPEPPKKYSVVGPDGVTYTGYEPMFIICKCGEQFASGTEWQAHRDYHSAYRCSCGGSFLDVGTWETHAGIFDAKTFMYTGKTREEASAEGHTLTNEDTHSAEYSAHNGWKTTGFPG